MAASADSIDDMDLLRDGAMEMNATSHHLVLYTAPPLTGEDDAVLGEIHQMRKDLRYALRMPRRWEGGLRRSAFARNIQGSNSGLYPPSGTVVPTSPGPLA